jgi:hypothetical protein
MINTFTDLADAVEHPRRSSVRASRVLRMVCPPPDRFLEIETSPQDIPTAVRTQMRKRAFSAVSFLNVPVAPPAPLSTSSTGSFGAGRLECKKIWFQREPEGGLM